VAMVAAFSESGSPQLTSPSLPDQVEPANERLGSSRQRAVIALTTVSESAFTVYGLVPTGADPGPRSNGVDDATPPTWTTVSQASLPQQTTLLRVPVKTGQSNNEVCIRKIRKRSILTG